MWSGPSVNGGGELSNVFAAAACDDVKVGRECESSSRTSNMSEKKVVVVVTEQVVPSSAGANRWRALRPLVLGSAKFETSFSATWQFLWWTILKEGTECKGTALGNCRLASSSVSVVDQVVAGILMFLRNCLNCASLVVPV